jgi:hypothetical protein
MINYFLTLLFIFSVFVCEAQIKVPSKHLENIKQKNTMGVGSHNENTSREINCDCWIEPDSTYIIGLENVDDASTEEINLPFNFCFFEETYNSLFINNNGNISFDESYGTFSSEGFPNNNFKMIAPFWSDVDTRGGNGQILYRITPNAIYINWIEVGYFSEHAEKLNSFQLIISDGSGIVLPEGVNTSFCYKDMQWTTGDASEGVNGFGGSPATVGANKGDGIVYSQLGRFDHEGFDFDGSFNNNDGVDWLDCKELIFNTCSNDVNIAPLVSGIILNDTIKICYADTFHFGISFLSPEIEQITSISIDEFPDEVFVIEEINNGNIASINGFIVADSSSIGFHTLNILGTDDGVNQAISSISLIVFISGDTGLVMTPEINGSLLLCEGSATDLFISNVSEFDDFYWSNGSSINPTTFLEEGTYTLTLVSNGCSKSYNYQIDEIPSPQPAILGDTIFCEGSSVVLSLSESYEEYTWQDASTNTTFMLFNEGVYSILVMDGFGCIGGDEIEVNYSQLNVSAITNDVTCLTDSSGSAILFINGDNGPFEAIWDNDQTGTTIQNLSLGNYNCEIVNQLGCSFDTTISIVSIATDPISIDLTANYNEFTNTYFVQISADGGTSPYNYTIDGNTYNSPVSISIQVNDGFYCCEITDALGCFADTCFITENLPSSVASYEGFQFEIYPNPAHDYLYLEGKIVSSEKIEVNIINLLGQSLQKNYFEKGGTLAAKICVENLVKGVYFLEINSNNLKQKQKLVIQ